MIAFEPEEQWLLPLLSLILQRPGMYLGDSNVRSLENFLHGYLVARHQLGFTEYGKGSPDWLQGFTQWLEKRYGFQPTCRGWCLLIECLDPSDSNISTFASLFTEYLHSLKCAFPVQVQRSSMFMKATIRTQKDV